MDGLNFFLADAQGGLGPFLGIYLLDQPGWNAATIGLVMTLGGVATLLAGAVIVLGGYDLAFLTLAGIALLALGLFAFAVPETSPTEAVVSP